MKILGLNFGNSILDISKWDKISNGIANKIHICNRVRLSLKGVMVNQILSSKLWNIGQICFIPKYAKKEYTISSGTRKKIRPPRRLLQLSLLTSRLGILDIEPQLNSLKIKSIQRLLIPNNALWKNLMLYQLNLILNYNQGLALFKQKQMLRSNSHKHLQKRNNEDFFVHLLNTWLHFTNSKFPVPTSEPVFYSIPPKDISDKFTIIS